MTNEDITSTDATQDLPPGGADAPDVAAPTVPGRFSASQRSKTILRENLLLVLLFAGGIMGVYLLSLRGGPSKASADQVQTEQNVESALTSLAKPPVADKDVQTIIDSFYGQARQRQIDMDHLHGNPFVFKNPTPITPTGPATKPAEAAAQPVNTDRNAAVVAVKLLSLQSVLTGSAGRLATISNNLLSEGQVISGWTVSKINPKDVVLTWRDQTYVLKMAE